MLSMVYKNSNIDANRQLEFNASAEGGLSSAEVEALKSSGLVNVTSNKSYKSVGNIIFDNVFTYFNLIYFALGFCLLLVGSYKDMFFLFVIILNIFIGIFQQIRSKIKIDKLTLISSLKCLVVRDGKNEVVLNSEVVLGDVIIFKTGDQINVDAEVLKGQVQVDESLLTGESDPILKVNGAQLLSGSFVLSGSCVARVCKVGDSCYACKLAKQAKENVKPNKSEMMSSLNKIIKVIGFTVIPFGTILFLKQIFIMHMQYTDAVRMTVAALVGMIPEGLYLLTSVALAVSVIKLIESKVLVHEMSCIETLARVDVLCVDKTGTITEPIMKVVGIKSLIDAKEFNVEEVLNAVVGNMAGDNTTAKALKVRFCKGTSWVADKVHPFLSSTKWFAVEFKDFGTYILGAAEFILGDEYVKVKDEVDESIKDGKRVLLLAKLEGAITNSEIFGNIVPLCLVLIENPIRKGVHKTFNFFQSQGVRIKVISGDNPASVLNVCNKANIKNLDSYVDASNLKSDEALKEATLKYDIFGRVTPEQKRKIVQFLQNSKEKHTVAMVGDGVNDVLALRDSDVGVAMASGSDAASQAAEMVLLNSDFDFMPKAVMEGRRVINNIQRFATLFLVKNIFSFSFAFLALFLNLMFPITPFQFTFISAITIGLPSFLLTMEPSTELVRGSFIKNVLKKALPGGVCNLLTVLSVQIFSRLFSLELGEISSISAVLLGLTGLVVLHEVCSPLNGLKTLVIAVMSFLMGVCIIFSKLGFCNIYGLSKCAAMFLVVAACSIRFILKFLILIFGKLKR